MNHSEKEYPILIAQLGPLNGNRFTLRETMLIGRDAACQIVIADRQVSRYHARMQISDEGIVLEDLSSKNGTYCNGKKLTEPIRLQDGDLVQIALIQHFVYLSSDATIPLEGGEGQVPEAKTNRAIFLDSRSRRVWVGQKELDPPLSVPQFRLLQILYENNEDVVSRTDLIGAIWGDEMAEGVSEQALDALVRRLRDRISQAGLKKNLIVTIRGHGLRLENPDL